jgi:pyridoxamine 5'-phosphate oxidase
MTSTPASAPASSSLSATNPLREILRSLPVLVAEPAAFDPDSVPDEPTELFTAWLLAAIEAGVPEAHAMTLSTCDGDGRPDARTLILKDVDAHGWLFATASHSAKGQQLASQASAALTFYWPALARQVRVRGRVSAASRERSAADFRARGIGARAVALAGTQSTPLASRDECAVAVRAAVGCIEAMPEIVSPTWTLYAVVADTVEFWQADQDRQHIRVQYRRDGDRWTHGMLWP